MAIWGGVARRFAKAPVGVKREWAPCATAHGARPAISLPRREPTSPEEHDAAEGHPVDAPEGSGAREAAAVNPFTGRRSHPGAYA
jgi:hypothetical protein